MKQLRRSKQNQMIAGVAGGLAEYFVVDVALVRLIWVLAVLAGGAGILAYIILWIVLPEESNGQESNISVWPADDPTVHDETVMVDKNRRQRNAGILLIGLGLIFLGAQFVPHWVLTRSWPLLLVFFGLFLLFKQGKEND